MAASSYSQSTTMSYSLTTLPRSEIVTVMTELNIMNISESDLLKPTPNFIFNLYSSLLIHLDPLQDDPTQMDFTALEGFENPDMHSEAIKVINLYAKIKDLLQVIMSQLDFKLDDLIRPDPARTAKLLSDILNFYLHMQSKLSKLRPYEEKLATQDEQRKEKEARISQLKDEIARRKEEIEWEKPLVLEAEAKVNRLRKTLDDLNTLQCNLQKERTSMKDKAQEMNANVSKAEFELIQATQENAILRAKIVQSPDKLQRALEEKKALETEAKNSKRQAMQNYQDRNVTLEVYTKAFEKMKKQLAQIQAIQEQVNSAKSVEKDVKQLKAKLSNEQMLDISLEAKLVEFQAKAEQSDEHKCQLEKEQKLKYEEDTKALNNVKSEAETRSRDFEARRTEIEAAITEADVLNAKIVTTKDAASATQQQLLRKGEEIANELNLYSTSIFKSMAVLTSEINVGHP